MHVIERHCNVRDTLSTDGSSSISDQGSIIGFAVVLSFLVLSILVVMLICSCYGLCKLPCKKTSTVPAQQRRQPRRNNPMIPLPSTGQPASGAIRQSSSSTFQPAGGKDSTTNKQPPTRLQLGQNHHTPASYTDGDRRRDSLSPSRYSAPPTSLSNVINLGQLQSHSFHSDLEQYATGSANLPNSGGRHSGRLLSHQIHHSHQQRSDLDPESHRQTSSLPQAMNDLPAVAASQHHPSFQTRGANVPPPYPGMGYPYTPCKSPRTPHGVVDDMLYARRLSGGTRHQHDHQSRSRSSRNAVRSAEESELTDFDIDTVTEGECNSVVSEHVRHEHNTATTQPQGYSTTV